MTARLWRAAAAVLALLLVCAAPAAAQAPNPCAGGGRQRPLDDSGIGGTGVKPADPDNDSGIGGTGARPVSPEDDDGIGGTGITAGETGLIGTITGFASICVGEIEIHYDTGTPVEIDGQPRSTADLAVGQVVEVVASGDSSLRASEIAVNHIVVGPVTHVDLDRNTISVIGQPVELPASDTENTAALQVGTVVQVSGMRRGDGLIVASRVTAADTSTAAQLSGPMLALSSSAIVVAGTEVRIAREIAAANGDEVRVVGRWNGEAIQAESIQPLPQVPFDGRVARVEIEGFARRSASGEILIGAFPVEAAPAEVRQSLTSDARLRVEGRVQGRQVIVERCEVMRGAPERPAKPENGGMRPGDQDHDHGEHRPGLDPEVDGEHHEGPPPGPIPHGGGPVDKPGPRPEMRGVDVPPRPEGAGGDRPEPPPRPERPDKPDHPGPPDRPPQPERPERPEKPERPDHPPERPNLERPDVPPRPDRVERPDPPPRIDRPGH